MRPAAYLDACRSHKQANQLDPDIIECGVAANARPFPIDISNVDPRARRVGYRQPVTVLEER